MDLVALRYWKASTWSKPDLVLLLPGLVVGIGFGYLLFRFPRPPRHRDRDGRDHPCSSSACGSLPARR